MVLGWCGDFALIGPRTYHGLPFRAGLYLTIQLAHVRSMYIYKSASHLEPYLSLSCRTLRELEVLGPTAWIASVSAPTCFGIRWGGFNQRRTAAPFRPYRQDSSCGLYAPVAGHTLSRVTQRLRSTAGGKTCHGVHELLWQKNILT
jgi:hypothetical protein